MTIPRRGAKEGSASPGWTRRRGRRGASTELEIVGCTTTAPTAVDVCSAYLVREGEALLLLDCGPGALHRVQERHGLLDLTAIIITHMHQDHCLDLLPAAGAMLIQRRTLGQSGKTRLLVPPGAGHVLQSLGQVFSALGRGVFHNTIEHAYEVEEYRQPGEVRIGPMAVHFSERLHHEAPCSAVRLESRGRALCYSGDTAPCQAIADHARGADLFLCEATFPQRRADRPYLHLAPEEAGEIARDARAGGLVLTHFARSDVQWQQGLKLRAEETFSGPVSLAARGRRIAL